MKRRAVPRHVALLLVLAGLALGCDAMRPRVDNPRPEYVRVPPPPPDSLRAAPETIAVGGLRIVAGAVLWLNLMPGPSVGGSTGARGTPLRGTIDIRPADTTRARRLPAGLALRGAWLRSGDSTWALAVVPSNATRAASTRLAQEVWGGPAWLAAAGSVDVVVRVRRSSGATALLQVRGVPVETAE